MKSNKIISLAVGFLLVVGATACSEGHNEQAPKPPQVSSTLENTLYMELKSGRVVIDLLPDLAPKHVARIKQLTRQNYYDGLKFHRVNFSPLWMSAV